MTQYMTITPNPPIAGQTATVKYSGSPVPTTLSADWDPASEPKELALDALGCVELVVPDGASSVVIHDPSGLSDDLATVVA